MPSAGNLNSELSAIRAKYQGPLGTEIAARTTLEHLVHEVISNDESYRIVSLTLLQALTEQRECTNLIERLCTLSLSGASHTLVPQHLLTLRGIRSLTFSDCRAREMLSSEVPRGYLCCMLQHRIPLNLRFHNSESCLSLLLGLCIPVREQYSYRVFIFSKHFLDVLLSMSIAYASGTLRALRKKTTMSDYLPPTVPHIFKRDDLQRNNTCVRSSLSSSSHWPQTREYISRALLRSAMANAKHVTCIQNQQILCLTPAISHPPKLPEMTSEIDLEHSKDRQRQMTAVIGSQSLMCRPYATSTKLCLLHATVTGRMPHAASIITPVSTISQYCVTPVLAIELISH
ncbi:hypothetical protein Tco_0009009 [Tanacetum coccineum]